MDTHRLPPAPMQATARLFIHAGSDVGAGGRHIEFPLGWLRALYTASSLSGERSPLTLQIDDLQGRQVLACENGGPLIVVALPAGTYHVNARRGNVRRAYTMTLNQGASFDLYLNLASVPQ